MTQTTRPTCFRNLSARVIFDGQLITGRPSGFIGCDIIWRRPRGGGGITAEAGDETVAYPVSDPAAARVFTPGAPLGDLLVAGIGEGRKDRTADHPGHDGGVMQIADSLTQLQRGRCARSASGDVRPHFDLQGHAPSFVYRQQAKIKVRVIGGGIA